MVDRTDEEQIEALKAWWQENGKALIFGIVLGISIIGGWRIWDGYREDQSVAASVIYQDLQTALRDNQGEAVREHGQQLLDEYTGTPYAVFAALALARQSVQEDDLESAAALLNRALDQADDPSIQHVARLRLVQVLIAQDKSEDAMSLIKTIDPGQFTAQYEELRGDILVAQGNTDAAREAYSVALANTSAEAGGRELLNQKLETLGPTGDRAE